MKDLLQSLAIYINQIEYSYSLEKLPTTRLGAKGFPIFDVDGRFLIPIYLSGFRFPQTIECRIPALADFDENYEESGQHLTLKKWEKQKTTGKTAIFGMGFDIEEPEIKTFKSKDSFSIINHNPDKTQLRLLLAWQSIDESNGRVDDDMFFALDSDYLASSL